MFQYPEELSWYWQWEYSNTAIPCLDRSHIRPAPHSRGLCNAASNRDLHALNGESSLGLMVKSHPLKTPNMQPSRHALPGATEIHYNKYAFLSLADNTKLASAYLSNLFSQSRHVYTVYIDMSSKQADSAMETTRETQKHLSLAMGSTSALPID